MKTTVTVQSHGHQVRVTTRDEYRQRTLDGGETGGVTEASTILQPGDGPWIGYATTTRTISIIDLDPLTT